MMPFLEAHGLSKHFGAVMALDRAELEVDRAEVHVLIGSNGSGKSTLCKILAGSVIPNAGQVVIDNTPTIINSPRDAARAGIGVFYQELSLVPRLTIQENLLLGRLPRRGPGFVNRTALERRARELVARFADVTGAGFYLDALVQDLRADQHQIVEILKTLATDARIIIFDEPTSSLDKRQVDVFFNLVRELRDQGRAIIFISHRMDEIFEIGDRVTVLRDGRTVACERIEETDRDRLVEHMVGGRIGRRPARTKSEDAPENSLTGDTVLDVSNLSGRRLDGIRFKLKRGEILGFGGLHGQGQSQTLRILFGADPLDHGAIELEGGGNRPTRPADAIRQGIAYISGDRGRDGVLLGRPILENLTAAYITRERRFFLKPKSLVRLVRPLVDRLKMRFSGFSAPISSLSGGNQQKAVIGRWLAVGPRILLLDDPTKGIDLEAKSDLYQIMRELAGEGVSMILYSSEDAELLGLADRVLVFNGGRIVRALAGDDMNAFNLYQAAYGTET